VSVLYPVSDTPGASVPSTVSVLSYTLSWTALSRATSYNIEETVPSGSVGYYTGASGTSRGFTQSAPGTWRYRVQGCNASGCGPWSAQASVTINIPQPPAVPTGLTVTQRSATNCRITWNAVSGASYYMLSEAGFPFSVSITSYTMDGICAHPYQVAACNSQGACSAYSDPR